MYAGHVLPPAAHDQHKCVTLQSCDVRVAIITGQVGWSKCKSGPG